MFLAEIRNEAAKPKTVTEGWQAAAGDTIIVEPQSRVESDGLANYLPGFSVTLSPNPVDGDIVRVVVKGYGHTDNAVSVRAYHPIDFRTTAQIPDGTFTNQYLADTKTLIIPDKNLETVFVYNGLTATWDTNTLTTDLDYRRLRPTDTELTGDNFVLDTIENGTAMWENPFNYDATITQEAVYGWSGPTACANHLGYIEQRFGPIGAAGDGADWPSTGTAILGDPQWHDHQYDSARPANTVTWATQLLSTVTDFGWYIGTNGSGAADNIALNAAVTYGTSIGNFVSGYRAFNAHIGESALNATDVSVSYNTLDTFPDPLANEGYAATLMENFDTNFQLVRDEIAANRPFFACFAHWNLTEKTNPQNKLPPETIGGHENTKNLPIKFYSWGAAQTTGPNNEQYYTGGVDDFEDTVGHWVLVVGYIETQAGYASTPTAAQHPHIAASSKYLIVVDDNTLTDANGASALNGMEQRVLKAIPITENGVTTGRANLHATVFVNVDNGTYAV